MKGMAESGYIMGLSTIGEVALHMELHYDAYFSIEHFADEMREFAAFVKGHEHDSIDLYLTEAEKKLIDDDMNEAFDKAANQPAEDWEREEETRGEEAKDEAASDEDHHADDGPRLEGPTGPDST